MRKLAWFIIIVAFLSMALAIIGLAYQPAGDALHYFFVEIIGVGGMNLLVGAATGLLLWGSANGLQAFVVIFSLWIFGGIIWVAVKKYLWDIPHTVKKAIGVSTAPTVVREEPKDIVITESAASTKSEKPKEEVIAPESTA